MLLARQAPGAMLRLQAAQAKPHSYLECDSASYAQSRVFPHRSRIDEKSAFYVIHCIPFPSEVIVIPCRELSICGWCGGVITGAGDRNSCIQL